MCSCSILLSYSSIVLSMTNIRLKLWIQYMSTTHKRLKIVLLSQQDSFGHVISCCKNVSYDELSCQHSP